jgi:hypothetical protein
MILKRRPKLVIKGGECNTISEHIKIGFEMIFNQVPAFIIMID